MKPDSMPVVFIGIGTMGAPMAARLVEAGYEVAVGDIDPAAVARLEALGARPLDGVSDAQWASSVVCVCLPGPEQVIEVVCGPGGIVERGPCRGYVDFSTVGFSVAVQTGEALAAAGIDAIEAPVSGGARRAREGSLTLMASGCRPLYDLCGPLLDLIAKRRFFVGAPIAAGQLMKLINNLLSATALAITTEGAVLGEKAGLDLELMLDVLNASSGRNSATADKFPVAVVPRTYDYGFTVGLVEKDLRLCLAAAEDLGVPMPVGEAVLELWRDVLAEIGERADYTSLVPRLERHAGVLTADVAAKGAGR